MTPYQEIKIQNLQGCLHAIAPAMLVVLSWMYVMLANINMVRWTKSLSLSMSTNHDHALLSTPSGLTLSGCYGRQEFFNCSKRGDRWFLAAEPSVECYDFSTSNHHRQLLPLCIVALLVYVIGIPVLFGILLFRYRKVSVPIGSAVPPCHR